MNWHPRRDFDQAMPASVAIALAYVPTYRHGETNRCPNCSRQHFHIGRSSVECAFCETAMPIAECDAFGSQAPHKDKGMAA